MDLLNLFRDYRDGILRLLVIDSQKHLRKESSKSVSSLVGMLLVVGVAWLILPIWESSVDRRTQRPYDASPLQNPRIDEESVYSCNVRAIMANILSGRPRLYASQLLLSIHCATERVISMLSHKSSEMIARALLVETAG